MRNQFASSAFHVMTLRPQRWALSPASGRHAPLLGMALIAAILLCGVRAHGQATWSPIVLVGPGYVDCYTRQVVRTSADVVYVITNASGFSGGTAVAFSDQIREV